MATVGNKVANDFYEHTMSNFSRKPGANSSPEECRRFVDDKYIHKKFAAEGFQEPVKDFVASKAKGTKPDFSYSTQYSLPTTIILIDLLEPQASNNSRVRIISSSSTNNNNNSKNKNCIQGTIVQEILMKAP